MGRKDGPFLPYLSLGLRSIQRLFSGSFVAPSEAALSPQYAASYPVSYTVPGSRSETLCWLEALGKLSKHLLLGRRAKQCKLQLQNFSENQYAYKSTDQPFHLY